MEPPPQATQAQDWTREGEPVHGEEDWTGDAGGSIRGEDDWTRDGEPIRGEDDWTDDVNDPVSPPVTTPVGRLP
jgi:hypothetical protein